MIEDNLELFVIIPVFNNEESLPELSRELLVTLNRLHVPFKILFVNDCSTDRSLQKIKLLSHRIPEIEFLDLKKNIGQQQAILCGLNTMKSEYYITMDADLQDQPEDIQNMYQMISDLSCSAVFAQRINRYQNLIRMITSRAFKYVIYLLVGLPTKTGGFVIFNQELRNRLIKMKTKHFYLAGLIARTRLKICTVQSSRNMRIHGKSSYGFLKRCKVAFLCLACLIERPRQ